MAAQTKRTHISSYKKNSIAKQTELYKEGLDENEDGNENGTETTSKNLIDTSTAYGVRQISRGQKKAAKDVRRAEIKKAKLKAKGYDYDPESKKFNESKALKGKEKRKAIKEARIKAKAKEAAFESEAMGKTAERIKDMAAAGVDPKITGRFVSNKNSNNDGSMSKGYSTSILDKKQGGMAMIKRSGVKMKGFGKKTYNS